MQAYSHAGTGAPHPVYRGDRGRQSRGVGAWRKWFHRYRKDGSILIHTQDTHISPDRLLPWKGAFDWGRTSEESNIVNGRPINFVKRGTGKQRGSGLSYSPFRI